MYTTLGTIEKGKRHTVRKVQTDAGININQ